MINCQKLVLTGKKIKMAKHIHKCTSCQNYTLKDKCPRCKEKTILPKPPKFSLNDIYTSYRRKVRKKELVEKGLC